MNSKRDAYVHTRVTKTELQIIDSLARHMRRTRSDTLRILALEKAEEIGLLSRVAEPPLKVSDSPINKKEEEYDIKLFF